MDIAYTPTFVRHYKKLPKSLKADVKRAIELFRSGDNHKALSVHKLKGKLKDFYSFSVNFQYRIIFEFADNKRSAWLHDIDDHDVYEDYA